MRISPWLRLIPPSSRIAAFVLAVSVVRAPIPGRAMTTGGDNHRTKQLQDLWATSYDAWTNVPQHDESIVYLRPVSGVDPTNSCKTLPAIVKEVSMFALTGFNPMGEDRAIELNRAANQKLREDLESLSNPRPQYVWDAFGFAKDWREDGFVIAYKNSDKHAGESAIVALAMKYEQGAIFGFEATDTDPPTSLIRRTIPAAMANVEADVIVVPCEKPEGIPFSEPSAFKDV